MQAGSQACRLEASRLAGREICRKACMQAGKQACRLEASWLTGRDIGRKAWPAGR